jgi:hypothetical protein
MGIHKYQLHPHMATPLREESQSVIMVVLSYERHEEYL